MIYPRRPVVPLQTVSKIEPSWFRDLDQCLEFAMQNPKPDGETILLQEGGTLRVANPNGSGGDGGESTDGYTGPFFVDLAVKDDKEFIFLRDGNDEKAKYAGYIRVGSKMQAIEVCNWDPKEGVVYAEVLYEDDDYTIDVYFESDLPQDSDPKRWVMRIANVSKEDDMWAISQIWTGGDIDVQGRWVK